MFHFTENEVDEIAFKYLNKSLICQIFQNKAGPIAIFERKYEIWKTGQLCLEFIIEKPTNDLPTVSI